MLIIKVSIGQSSKYSFYVAGHAYGSPLKPSKGFYPPLLENLLQAKDTLSFGVLTGDVVYTPDTTSWQYVINDIEKTGLPVNIAGGNHDMGDRQLFAHFFETSDSSYTIGKDIYLIFDNTKFWWALTPEQTKMLDNAIKHLKKKSRLFIFWHNVPWQEKYWCAHSNSQVGRPDTNYFRRDIIPKLKAIKNQVYWFAGDVGATPKSKNATYVKEDNIHLITSGIGNNKFNNYLIVDVYKKKVEINAIPLEETYLLPIPIEKFLCK